MVGRKIGNDASRHDMSAFRVTRSGRIVNVPKFTVSAGSDQVPSHIVNAGCDVLHIGLQEDLTYGQIVQMIYLAMIEAAQEVEQ